MVKMKFKIHVSSEENPWSYKEVRKVNIDSDIARNFTNLCEKLQTIIFPGLQGTNYGVTWQDEESTNITIANNEEWEIALEDMARIAQKNNADKVYNLYIRLSEDAIKAWPGWGKSDKF
ncbi:uncharacterized protein LOC105838428 [Monomorium pharaonis]|uniref:uncharacterized protein LOC105838428 n=1 Tax=Monomorium pharaonis TaxID=307658 RepID=UPI00063F84B7|nr:uncharacterized protein LOC105838428 [Monomorium pharaonis]